MKTTSLMIAVALAAAGNTAFAMEATPYPVVNDAKPTMSREQVKTELTQAIQAGTVHVFGNDYRFAGASLSKSREQVRAEFVAARADGAFAELTGEAHGSHIAPRAPVYAKAR